MQLLHGRADRHSCRDPSLVSAISCMSIKLRRCNQASSVPLEGANITNLFSNLPLRSKPDVDLRCAMLLIGCK